MAPKIDKREEGLRELASMIADAYRRRMTGEITRPLSVSEDDDSDSIAESEIIARIEPNSSGPGFVYTETVRVENFIRNKKPRGNHRGNETID